ncbi:Single Cache domain-containing protein [Desulfonema limicola]|uniref:Single Cache domain-containing protein n=1 Tax=Desulfonema limicola TaxID=45656 RepID=A0A975B766_9BACT|nr:cache domain-containing protein [Desulfonema limicola]QTA80056.1 Single Cache domain-containing protein [Desulfonema limicola]
MKKTKIIVLTALFLLPFKLIEVHAQEKATPQEVIQKVKEASEFLSKAGEEGLKEFMDKNGRWVWKDTYIFIMYCKALTVTAHPIKPKLIGKNLMGLKDVTGKLFFAEFCKAEGNPKGLWVEYMWQKVDEKMPSRKISFLMQVPGTDYQAAAGIYDETISLEELNRLK